MKHRIAKILAGSIVIGLLLYACKGTRTEIRSPQREISDRSIDSGAVTSDSPADETLDETKAELEAAKKQLSELENAKANASKDPKEIARLQEEVDQANRRVADAESALKKKDQDAAASQAAQEKAKRDFMGYSLQYKHSLKCLEIDGNSQVDGARILQVPCNLTNIQLFRLVQKTSGSWIQNLATGKCMATLGGGTINSTQIVQATCVESGPMLFVLLADANGFSFIKNVGSNRCVDIEAISTADRAGAQIYDCLNGDAQRVKLIPAAP